MDKIAEYQKGFVKFIHTKKFDKKRNPTLTGSLGHIDG